MVTINANSIFSRLDLCDLIERTYRRLQPFAAEFFKVTSALLDPRDGGSVRVRVNRYGSSCEFTITLPLSELDDLTDVPFSLYLARQWVTQMPDSTRIQCSDALDTWAAQVGKLPRRELRHTPPIPIVEDAR